MGILEKIKEYVKNSWIEDEGLDDEIEKLIDDGNLSQALVLSNAYLKRDSENLYLWTQKASILYEMFRFEEANLAYERVLKLKPSLQEAWYAKGVILFELGHFEDCIITLDKAIEMDPKDADSFSCKAVALMNLGKLNEAMGEIEKAIHYNLEDNYLDFREIKASIFSELNKHDGAIALLEGNLSIDPENIDTLVTLSAEYILVKDFKKAIEVADEALAITNEDPAVWGNKGEALYELGKVDEALDCTLKSQNLDPSDDEVWYQKARILSERIPEDALDSLLVAVSINPENKKRAQTENSFEIFRENERFKKMTESVQYL